MDQPGHRTRLVSIWDPGACERRISQVSHCNGLLSSHSYKVTDLNMSEVFQLTTVIFINPQTTLFQSAAVSKLVLKFLFMVP